jgi:4a-hydroxytetrahydrobiopterin dehydratase
MRSPIEICLSNRSNTVFKLGGQKLNESTTTPVNVNKSSWDRVESPERIMKDFEFHNFESMFYFVKEVMQWQEENFHHAKITLDNRVVRVETFTHDYNSVTERDFDLARAVDNIFDDISYFESKF